MKRQISRILFSTKHLSQDTIKFDMEKPLKQKFEEY